VDLDVDVDLDLDVDLVAVVVGVVDPPAACVQDYDYVYV
jgi:hypothetical protein